MKKLTYIYRIFFALVFLQLYNIANAQLLTSTGMTPVQLVENVLVGSGGVGVSNITYTGNLNAIGSFDGSNTNVGINSGIILTTGTVLNTSGALGGAQGPHGPNNRGSAGIDNGVLGYAPLTALVGDSTYNAAVLEFDFIPNSDTIKFRYVFGSEEYPEFVNAGYNDVFAIFISGPGYIGDFNLALLPNGEPVSINNLNDTTNSEYYVNNGNGSTAPQNEIEYYIQYDGFSVVLEAMAEVQIGETYHITIAIADVWDGSYDSGLFIEANSPFDMSHIQKNTSELNFDIYFSDGVFYIKNLKEEISNDFSLKLFSLDGKEIFTYTIFNDMISIPNHIPNGMYIYQFTYNSEVKSGKIINN